MLRSGSTYYMMYDQVGSLRLIVDSTGTTIKKIDYDSFGNIINDTNPGFTIPFGFAGGLHDVDTGLVRFGARDFDASVGRWTAKDPIDFAGGDVNLYGYVQNNPVNFIDPLGLYGWKDVVGGVAILTGGSLLAISSPAWVPIAGGVLIVGGAGLLAYDTIVGSIKTIDNFVDEGKDGTKDYLDQFDEFDRATGRVRPTRGCP